MWTAVELAKDHSAWNRLSESDDVNRLKNEQLEKSTEGQVYYFWEGEFPKEPAALQALYEKVVEANGGVQFKMMVGASVGPVNAVVSPSSCSGQLCFCTVSGNSRGCEVCYQAPNGAYCTSCSGSC